MNSISAPGLQNPGSGANTIPVLRPPARRACAASTIAASILAFSAKGADARGRDAQHAPGEPPGVIAFDDQGIEDRLVSAAEAALPHATSATQLVRELERRHTRLKLPPGRSSKLTAGRIYSESLPGVLAIAQLYRCPKCHRHHVNVASGFVLTESGAAATCHHVVNQPNGECIVALTGDGRIAPVVEVLAADPANDVAILRLDGSGFHPLPVAPDAAPGTPVYIIGNPDQHFFTMTAGMVSRYHKYRDHGRAPMTLMSVTADFARGSSGGPALNEAGFVVGLAQSTAQVYYNTDDSRKDDLQMVVKECVPVRSLLGLLDHD
jgi:serine protease Do